MGRKKLSRKKLSRKKLEAKVKLQQETLAYLELHIGRYEVSQLTAEQKDCLADAVDARYRAPWGLEPYERWWRD